MVPRRRDWNSYNALQFVLLGITGGLIAIMLAGDDPWIATVVGLASILLLILGVTTILRNDRVAKSSKRPD